jgi:hypothetical protein
LAIKSINERKILEQVKPSPLILFQKTLYNQWKVFKEIYYSDLYIVSWRHFYTLQRVFCGGVPGQNEIFTTNCTKTVKELL